MRARCGREIDDGLTLDMSRAVDTEAMNANFGVMHRNFTAVCSRRRTAMER